MADVFEKPEDLSDYLFRIVDNGGSSADRYMVVFSDGSYLGMSGSPSHPQGVSMCGEGIDPATVQNWVDEGQAIDLALGDLPKNLVEHIMFRNNEGLEEFIDAVEAREEYAVAPDRSSAKANTCDMNCLGTGIYVKNDKYWVKLDENDDRGPYDTAREVILASMPDPDCLGGDDQSTLNLMRMTPDPDVLEAVKALEARRQQEWEEELERRY
jgi:hypothetical protein